MENIHKPQSTSDKTISVVKRVLSHSFTERNIRCGNKQQM